MFPSCLFLVSRILKYDLCFLWSCFIIDGSFPSGKVSIYASSPFLPHRLVLPSPWLTSQASLLCLWAQGRPTTTCAASTPAPWSAPWWRLKWLHVLLLIHQRNKANNTFAVLLWDIPAPNQPHPPSSPLLSSLYFHRIKNLSFTRRTPFSKEKECKSQRGLPLYH